MLRERGDWAKWAAHAAGTTVLVVLLVSALSACGRDANAPRPHARHAAGTIRHDWSSSRAGLSPLPSRAIKFMANAGSFPADRLMLSAAEALLTTRCMNDAGFKYYPGVPLASPPTPLAMDLYTVDGRPPPEAANLAARSRVGYGLFAFFTALGRQAASGGPNVQRNQRYVASLGAAAQRRYDAVLLGVGSPQRTVAFHDITLSYTNAGCHSRALAKLYGSVRMAELATAIGEYAFGLVDAQTKANQGVRVRLAAWSNCFVGSTHMRVANPNDAAALAQERYARVGPTRTAHTYERALAVADGRCQYSSGLAQTFSATFHALANALPHSLARTVERSAAIAALAATHARAVVHGNR